MTWTNTFVLLHQNFATAKINFSIKNTSWIPDQKTKQTNIRYKTHQLQQAKEDQSGIKK